MQQLKRVGQGLVGADGREVILRGVAIGGWLNMENFITGFAGNESAHRQAMRRELGAERAQAFFSALLGSFFTEADVHYLAGLGCNTLRVPFASHHFLDQEGEVDPAGLARLDAVISWAKAQGLYIILDLHAAPGWQNRGWHCDNPYGISLFWGDRHFQEWALAIWRLVADHYRDEEAVAGYDLLNEPDAPEDSQVAELYRRWIPEIRRCDPHHLLFLEGNRYARDFGGMESLRVLDQQTVFSSHNYMLPTHQASSYPGSIGMEPGQNPRGGQAAGPVWVDRSWVEEEYRGAGAWFTQQGEPCWVGEFGALYDGGVGTPSGADRARLAALADQIRIFNAHQVHWTLWTYKDVDIQGLQVVRKDSEFGRRIAPFLALKSHLGVDQWTARGRGPLVSQVERLVNQVDQAVTELTHDFALSRSDLRDILTHRAIYGDVANHLNAVYARSFADLSVQGIAEVVRSGFDLQSCSERRPLAEVIAAGCHGEL